MNQKQIVDMTKEELNELRRPMAKAKYKHEQEPKKRGRPKNEIPSQPNDRITCSVCGKEYNRSGLTKHKKTKFHQDRDNLNKKLIKLLLE
jgi:hypothetical protein